MVELITYFLGKFGSVILTGVVTFLCGVFYKAKEYDKQKFMEEIREPMLEDLNKELSRQLDEKLDSKFEELKSNLSVSVTELNDHVRDGFESVDTRLDTVEAKLADAAEGSSAALRNTIRQACYKKRRQGWVTVPERDDIYHLYEAYEKLVVKNGVINRDIEILMSLPNEPQTDDK